MLAPNPTLSHPVSMIVCTPATSPTIAVGHYGESENVIEYSSG